jgi:hypothetical protein
MNHIIEQQKERARELIYRVFALKDGLIDAELKSDEIITQTHQATIAEVVRIIKDELQNAPLEVQMTKGVIFANIINRITSNKE